MWPCLYVSCDDPLTLPHYIVTAKTDSLLLLGGLHDQPWPICEDKTSEWIADEIELNISVDDRDVLYISNDEVGGMEQDAVRDLAQLPEFVPYRLGEGFRVIEFNDIDSHDFGLQVLPPHDQLADNLGLFMISGANQNDNTPRIPHVNVDEDTYDILGTVTTYDDLILNRIMRALVVNSSSANG
jgi:hypothetical protein